MTFESLDEYKVGWWKKGKSYRFCYGVSWIFSMPMVKYQTKNQVVKGSSSVTGLNPVADNWFPNAEYVGKALDLRGEAE